MKTRAILSSAATLIVIVLFSGMLQTANGQKVFATKSGQIYFNATGALVKIAAVNNQVDSKFVDATGQIIFGVLIKGLLSDLYPLNFESCFSPTGDIA